MRLTKNTSMPSSRLVHVTGLTGQCKSSSSSLLLSAANENRPLSTATRPSLYRAGSRKAPPTVSLTNTTTFASCVNHRDDPPTDLLPLAQNIIPFPSVPFPACSEPDCASLLRAGSAPSTPHPRVRPRASQVELRHRRSQARLAQSPLARKDAQKGRSKTPDAAARTKKRGATPDVQLLATMYRSVVSRLQGVEGLFGDDGGGGDGSSGDGVNVQPCGEDMEEVMEAQERLFVQRLCESMVELGCSPVPVVTTVNLEPVSSLAFEYAASAASRVCESPFLREPLAPDTPEIADIPSNPVTPRVLTMPQLVATLLLRHRERVRRVARRARSPAGGSQCGGENGNGASQGSPLAMSIDADI